MANILLSSEQRGLVTYVLWNSLAYPVRMLIGVGGIVAGFGLQYALYLNTHGEFRLSTVIPGAVLILAGNLFLLVRGCDNRVNLGRYSASAAWEKVDQSKFVEVEHLVKQMKKWDRSFLDVSNAWGKVPFFFLLFGLAFFGFYAVGEQEIIFLVLAVDAALLLLPHWITGQRSIMTQPNLLLKSKFLKQLLANKDVAPAVVSHQVEYFMLLKGDQGKVPDDVKFRVSLQAQHPDFLGYYGQVVTNSVKSSVYPYFYVVLVAKAGFGLQRAFDAYNPSRNITKEFKTEGDVEVFVIRQTTTKTSGYHTNHKAAQKIFLEGLRIAEQAVVK